MTTNANIMPVNGTGRTAGKSPRDYLREREAKREAAKRREARQLRAEYREHRIQLWA